MGIIKLKIDLNLGYIEVEGDEAFVQSVYTDYKDIIFGKANSQTVSSKILRIPNKKTLKLKTTERQRSKKKSQSGASASGTFLKNLDLSGSGKIKRLKEYYLQYKVTSNFERNLIFVYYLGNEKKEKNITIDHIFTCYKEVGGKVPKALQQSLLDTAHRKGWIDTSQNSDIKITVSGDNYMNHDIGKVED